MPDCDTASLAGIRRIEECAFNAWPAFTTLLSDGWVLRVAGGYTKRANSINAWQPTAPLAELLPHATALYSVHDLPVIVRVTPLAPAGTDEMLAARGFARVDETIVMTASLAALVPETAPTVTISAEPTEDWSSGFATANAIPAARRAIHDRMLAAIPAPRAFASLVDGKRAIGWGLAAAERGHVGLFDIVTLPDARRQGAARRLVSHLLAWGGSTGAETAYLQVVATNTPAIALYDRLGFTQAYRYHYRIAPV